MQYINSDALDQVRKLIDFLQPVLIQTDLRNNYVTTWTKLEGAHDGSQDMWNDSPRVHLAYEGDIVNFWRNLRDTIQTQFTTYIGNSSTELGASEHLDQYNKKLMERVKVCLECVDDYIELLEDHKMIDDSPEDYNEDELQMTDQSIMKNSHSKAELFMDVILFMFAVPSIHQSNAKDLKADFDLQIDPCKFYQDQEDFMSFLRDCALVFLTSNSFTIPEEITRIYRRYFQLYFVVPEKTLSGMRDIENQEIGTCRVCYENTRDVILFPCQHFILCHECAFNPKFVKDNRCPLCFQGIEKVESVQTLVKDNKIDFKQGTHLPKQSISSLLTQLYILEKRRF